MTDDRSTKQSFIDGETLTRTDNSSPKNKGKRPKPTVRKENELEIQDRTSICETRTSGNAKYDILSEKLKEIENMYDIEVKHRSMQKVLEGTNKDIFIKHNKETVCGIYFGKDKYKIWTNMKDWRSITKYTCSPPKDDGFYHYHVFTVEECADEIRKIAKYLADNEYEWEVLETAVLGASSEQKTPRLSEDCSIIDEHIGTNKYDVLFHKLKDLEKEFNIEIKHHSIQKALKGICKDIEIKNNRDTLCGIYIAKSNFKIWSNLKGWRNEVTQYSCSQPNADGYYQYYVSSTDECYEEIRKIAQYKCLDR